MGYELYIVRRNDWEDYEENSNITLDEWLAYVKSDNELELSDRYKIKIPGVENSSQNAPGFCIWTGHSTKVTDNEPWFDYGYGMISAKHPDDETIKKMITIADKFNGRVQGDDGEFYDDTYFTNRSSQETDNIIKSTINKPWWMFW